MSQFQLAQLNIARMVALLEEPPMAPHGRFRDPARSH